MLQEFPQKIYFSESNFLEVYAVVHYTTPTGSHKIFAAYGNF